MATSKFVILSYPRTGSTFFVKVLDGAVGVTCHSEIFHGRRDVLPRAFHSSHPVAHAKRIKLFGVTIGNRSEKRALDYLYALKRDRFRAYLQIIFQEDADAVGFKIFHDQHNAALEFLINQQEYRKIVLWRENTLKSYVSLQKALLTDVWDHVEGQSRQVNPVVVTYQDFLAYHSDVMNRIEGYKQKLRETGQRFLIYSYEQFTDSFPFEEVSEFLGVSLNRDFRANHRKQNPDELRLSIANYEEVEEMLRRDNLTHLL